MVVNLPARDDPSRLHKRPKPPPVTMGTRIEQLPAEKGLLQFIGEQRRGGHHLDNGRAIRRGLQAAHITEPYHRAVFAAPVVLAGPASPNPSYSPPTSPLFHPSSTTCWSTAAPPPTWEKLDGQPFAATGRGAIAHETVPLAMWGKVNGGQLTEHARGSRAVAFPPAALAASAADGTSCGGSWRQQLAAEALLGMARTGGTPMPLPHAMPMANKHFVPAQSLLQPRGPAVPVALQQYAPPLQYGESYFQPAAPPCWSIAPPPPPPAYPYSLTAPQPPPPAYPYSTIARPQPPASVRLYYPVLPSAHPYSTIARPQPPPPAYCGGTTTLWNAPPGALQKKFETLVMCNFKPRRPSELPTSRWVSFKVLFCLFEPHAPGEVWLMGPGNLKQLIIKWYTDHPAYKGLAVTKWCKRLTNYMRDSSGQGSYTSKFCFECTVAQTDRGHLR